MNLVDVLGMPCSAAVSQYMLDGPPGMGNVRESHYELGPSPLVLHWKDALCSRYFIDTDKDGNMLPQQV
eukprot:4215130-Pyramimonas_sp.AAC.1